MTFYWKKPTEELFIYRDKLLTITFKLNSVVNKDNGYNEFMVVTNKMGIGKNIAGIPLLFYQLYHSSYMIAVLS